MAGTQHQVQYTILTPTQQQIHGYGQDRLLFKSENTDFADKGDK